MPEPDTEMRDEERKEITDLRSAVETTGSTRDRLPPLTTYRRGLLARLELWLKRQLKRSTQWYVWEQVNFNSAVHSSLSNVLAMLSRHEERLSELEDANARLTSLESQVNELRERNEQLSAQQREQIGLLTDEQRVCLKQLLLQVSELSVAADRTKRNLQLELEQLDARVSELEALKTAIAEKWQETGALPK